MLIQLKINKKYKMKNQVLLSLSTILLLIINNCEKIQAGIQVKNLNTNIKEETVSYTADGVTMKGFVAYDGSTKKKRPVILIVHEWWGLTDYTKDRAKQLAALGYLAIAVDMFGDGIIAENPEIAAKLSGPFNKDPMKAKTRFDAALMKIKTYDIADTNKIAAIGYCFGGAIVLNVARLGENLKGVVSFHGFLIGVPVDKKLLKAKILICHGEADKSVTPEDVVKFKKQMDDAGVHYVFKSYPNATHAFSNPKTTETGKKFSMPIEYNEAADKASFEEMKRFFDKLFYQ